MAGALRLKHPHTQYLSLTRFVSTSHTAKQKEMDADIPTGRVVLHILGTTQNARFKTAMATSRTEVGSGSSTTKALQ